MQFPNLFTDILEVKYHAQRGCQSFFPTYQKRHPTQGWALEKTRLPQARVMRELAVLIPPHPPEALFLIQSVYSSSRV